MKLSRVLPALGVVSLLVVGSATADPQKPDVPKKAPAKTPDVTGAWIGTWGPLDPPKKVKEKAPNGMPMECKVVMKDGTWSATFEGECGRPYKYTIKMDGRAAGGAVLFKGTTDLGPDDGGVYDWIGRASDTEFVGFYTSEKYTGVFRLTRKK
jgi:hypothetical protein